MNRRWTGGPQRGFTLLEVLIALGLYVALLAGATAMQLQALRASEEAGRRVRASAVARDFLARASMAGTALPAAPDLPATGAVSCRSAVSCTRRQFAAAVIREWSAALGGGGAAALPPALPGARYCASPDAPRLAVRLSWPALTARYRTRQAVHPCAANGGSRASVELETYLGAPR